MKRIFTFLEGIPPPNGSLHLGKDADTREDSLCVLNLLSLKNGDYSIDNDN